MRESLGLFSTEHKATFDRNKGFRPAVLYVENTYVP